MVSNVDYVPTLLELLGVEIPDSVQGRSAAAILRGESGDPIRDAIFAEHVSHALRDNLSRCIRTDRWKLIRNFEPGRTIIKPIDADPVGVAHHYVRPRRNGARPYVQLFDLHNDPIEYDNLSDRQEYAPLVKELSDRLWEWMEDVGDPLLSGPLRTPYYEGTMRDYDAYRSAR
jgi:arylsulfatase A-like enzyme